MAYDKVIARIIGGGTSGPNSGFGTTRMFKNTASQKMALFEYNTSTGAAVTGDATNITPYVAKDWGTLTSVSSPSVAEISSSHAPGWYTFNLSQGETNADALFFSAVSSTSSTAFVDALVFTDPPLFTTLGIDSSGHVTTTYKVIKNTALANYPFVMFDSTTHLPKSGLTVTATRSLDGAAFGSCTNSVSELSSGVYLINLAAGDLNANTVTLKFTATGADATIITLVTQ